MAHVNPMKIVGRWRKGFALDYHVLSSIYVGDDEFGHPQFCTQRSELGELLYRLKYRSDASAVAPLAHEAAEFVRLQNWGVQVIVPVPPTRADRPHQPVLLVAAVLGELLGLPVCERGVIKTKDTPQLKDVFDYNERLSLLEDAFEVDPSATRGRKVLLFDDLYRSGATMNAVASAVYDAGGAADVLALAVTRTRRR
ncbi:MAG: ComF family protein [Planctomycetota bacterium]|nr:ComF family protein [Planctomycetota bacterium]